MADMPLVGLRQFREKLDTFKEPIRVIKTRGDVIVLGVWLPAGEWDVAEDVDSEGYAAYRLVRKVSSKKD